MTTVVKEYTFKLTYAEAAQVVDALKSLPMNRVEGIVKKMDAQYLEQYNEENASNILPPASQDNLAKNVLIPSNVKAMKKSTSRRA